MKSRIYAIDQVRDNGPLSTHKIVGYNNLDSDKDKFLMLKQTNVYNIRNLPKCKSLTGVGTSNLTSKIMPLDIVLQTMFMLFLDVVLEGCLKGNVYAHRKGRDPRLVVGAVTASLKKLTHTHDFHIASIHLKKCFDNIDHNRVEKEFPFPNEYKFLLSRWLKPRNINIKTRESSILTRGVLQNSIIGPHIMNFFLSRSLPDNLRLQRKGYMNWVRSYCYEDNIILIANGKKYFDLFLNEFKRNLEVYGLEID